MVDKSDGWLKAFDEADKLVAMFTVTTGSSYDPLPLGEWGINGVAHNPPFAYDPELFWDIDNIETITKAEHDSIVQAEERRQESGR